MNNIASSIQEIAQAYHATMKDITRLANHLDEEFAHVEQAGNAAACYNAFEHARMVQDRLTNAIAQTIEANRK